MNPFLSSNRLRLIKVNEVSHTTLPYVQEESYIKSSVQTTTYFVEEHRKVQVYHLPYINNILYKEMSASGLQMYIYVIHNLLPESDFINLKLDGVTKKTGLSRATIIRGITSLEDVGMLAVRKQSEYWVNPLFVFNGDRIRFYATHCPECVDVVAKVSK